MSTQMWVWPFSVLDRAESESGSTYIPFCSGRELGKVLDISVLSGN